MIVIMIPYVAYYATEKLKTTDLLQKVSFAH